MADEKAPDFSELDKWYILVGKIASTYAAFELHLDNMIWHLADMKPRLGSCVTSQIGNIHAKSRAIVALLSLFEDTDAMIDKTNKLSADARAPVDARARAVHDAWIISSAGEIAQLTNAIIGKTPTLAARPADLDRLKKTLKELSALMVRANDLYHETKTAVSPSKDKWRKPPPDITLGQVGKKDDPSPS